VFRARLVGGKSKEKSQILVKQNSSSRYDKFISFWWVGEILNFKNIQEQLK